MAKRDAWEPKKKYLLWRTWKGGFKSHLLRDGSSRAFRGRARQSHDVYERFFFRGQRDPSWRLEPTFDRRNRLRAKKRNKLANELVERFLIQAKRVEALDYPQGDEVAPIAVAQHHGLPTGLLDWSASPYVAAFFAFEDRVRTEDFSGDVAVWALDTAGGPNDRIIDESCRFLRLTDHGNVRIGNQQGAFTLLEAEDGDLRSFVRSKNKSHILMRFLIPAHQAIEALDDLILMGIHRANLFPDREGAAAHVDMLSRLEELRNRFQLQDGRIDVEVFKNTL